MKDTKFLYELGLSEKEARTYLACLELGGSTIKPIADRAKLKRTTIYNFIENLVGLGLIRRSITRGRTYYFPEAPERLIELQAKRLTNAQDALPALLSMFNRASGRPSISVFYGPEEIRNIVQEEVRCKKETRYIWPGSDILKMVGGSKYFTELDRERIKRGIWVRTIRFRSKDVRFATSANGPKFFRELRYGPSDIEMSMGLGLYDTRKVAFIGSHREGFGILIESPELHDMMLKFHQLLWVRSTPVALGEG